MSEDPLKQEFTGSNGEIVRVELPYQGYDVEFKKMELKIDDPLFRSPFVKNGNYEFIKPIIWLEAKIKPHGKVIHKFNLPLKFSVEFAMDIFKDVDLDPPMVAEEIKIAILNERDQAKPVWEPYPTSITESQEPDKWIATIAIVEWTSHACYGK